MSEAVKVGEPTSTTVGFIVPPRSKALEVDEEEEEGKSDRGVRRQTCNIYLHEMRGFT